MLPASATATVERVNEAWVRPRPDAAGYRRDVVAAALVALGAVVSLLLYLRIGYYDEPAPAWVSVVTIATFTLPLAARRRYPEAVAVVISIGFFLSQQFSVPELLFSNIALFMAIYTVGAWSHHRRAATVVRVLIIVAMFVWISVNVIVTVNNPDFLPEVSRSGLFSQFASFALIQ